MDRLVGMDRGDRVARVYGVCAVDRADRIDRRVGQHGQSLILRP